MQTQQACVALVTGAGGTIGRAIALRLARAGMHVLAADVDHGAAWESADAARAAASIECAAVTLDVGDAASFARAVAQCTSKWGGLDVLVNNAGVTQTGRPFTADVTERLFDHMVRVNLKGAWLGMKSAIPAMKGGGCIVNIASVQGLVGLQSVAIYSGTKHALIGLTQSAALEYGACGVRINAVCPGRMEAPMKNLVDAPAEPAQRARLTRERQPASQRETTAAEIADTVAFLCSPAASFIHGAAVPVDGGNLAQ